MKKLFLFLISFSAMSADFDECSLQYKQLGDGSGKDKITEMCKDLVVNQDNKKIKVVFKDEEHDLEYNGLNNVLVSIDRNLGFKELTAGSASVLQNVIAMDYDHEHKELYVLDGNSNQVLVYMSPYPGNVSPIRIVEVDQIIGAIDLSVIGDSLYVLNSQTNKVIVMNRVANAKAPQGKRYLNVVQAVDVSTEADRLEVEEGNLVLYGGEDKLMTLTLE